MESTPNKSDLNISSLIPIRFLSSPVQSQNDTQGIRSRLREIIKNLQENQKKWEAAQKRGLSLCMSIEAIKTRVLVSGGELYPKELKSYCEKLKLILTIFEDILSNAKTVYKQIKAIASLSRNSQEIIFRTWSVRHYLKFVEKVVEAYQKEFDAKKCVTECIAHSKDRSELALHTSVWESLAYTEDDFLLRFLFVGVELRSENR